MTTNGFKRLFSGSPTPTEAPEAPESERVFEIPTSGSQTPVRAAARPSGETASPAPNPSPPTPEVSGARTRRRYSATFKRRILDEADRCEAGQLGALLRREGLYSSTLQDFRRQQAQGALDPAAVARKATDQATEKAYADADRAHRHQLETENRRLKRQLKQAQTIIEFQKKLSELLGIPLESDLADPFLESDLEEPRTDPLGDDPDAPRNPKSARQVREPRSERSAAR